VQQHHDDAWPLEHYGYVYEGLRQVGWQSLEAVTLLEWCRQHHAHSLLTYCDATPHEQLPPDIDSFAPAQWPADPPAGFVRGAYVLSCASCEKRIALEGMFVEQARVALSEQAVETFVTRVIDIASENWYRHPPYRLQRICSFLIRHAGHSVFARVAPSSE
jgi:hypothetical protein